MAKFEDHIQQARNNLSFLSSVNQQLGKFPDWQVTASFYTALHLVNAHLSHFGQQYRKHHDVNFALNPDKQISVSKLPEQEYDAYIALQRLSRRSRYLVNEKEIGSETAFHTYDKHLARAIRYLDILLVYFSARYKVAFPAVHVSCADLKKGNHFRHFLVG